MFFIEHVFLRCFNHYLVRLKPCLSDFILQHETFYFQNSTEGENG